MAYNLYALVNITGAFTTSGRSTPLENWPTTSSRTTRAVAKRDPKLVCKINIERAMIALSEATGDARYRDYIVNRENLSHWSVPIDVVNAGRLAPQMAMLTVS